MNGNIFAATTRDVSEGGASLLTDAPLVDGSTIALTLILTEDGIECAHTEAFCTQAHVMWTSPTDNGEVMAGVRFEALGAGDARTLSQLLAAQTAGQA